MRAVRAAWGLALICLLAAVLGLGFGHPGRPLSAVLDVLPQLLAALTVALCSRQEVGERAAAWRLLTLAILTYAWTSVFYIAERGAVRRFPGVGDLSIALYPAMLAAMLLFWRSRAPERPRAYLLDAAIAGLALAALDDAVLIVPRVGGGVVGLATYGQVVYAAGDVFLLGFLIAGTVLAQWPPPRTDPWLALGLALMSFSDTLFAAHVARGGVDPVRLTELGWALATVVLAGAATTVGPAAAGPAPRFAAVAVPAAAVAAALPVVITWKPDDDPARLIIATLAVALAGLRLALSLAENLQLLERARGAAARQGVVAEIGSRALAGEDLDTLFAEAARLSADALGVEFGVVVEHDEHSGAVLRTTHGLGEPSGEAGTGELTLLATRSGQQVIIEDWATESRFATPQIARRAGAGSAAVTPIPSRHPHAWVLAVGSRAPRRYGPADVAFLETVANVLATALGRFEAAERLRAQAAARRRLVVQTLESGERERRRIAEGLHDLALQEVLAARQELDELAASDAPLVHRARDGLARAARDLRETVTELHPVVLEHAGLEPALEAVARRQAVRAGFTYELEIDPIPARGREEILVSLARELVSNAARHAQATRLRLRVLAAPGGVALEVHDDGTGADGAAIERAARLGHIGLASWTERVEALGGTLSVGRGAGGGTCARAELPAP